MTRMADAGQRHWMRYEMHVWEEIWSLIKSQRSQQSHLATAQDNVVLTFNLHSVIYWGHQLRLLKFLRLGALQPLPPLLVLLLISSFDLCMCLSSRRCRGVFS